MVDNVFIDESEDDSDGEDVKILEDQPCLPLEKGKAKDRRFVEIERQQKANNGVLHALQESFILQRKLDEHDGSFAKPPQNRVRRGDKENRSAREEKGDYKFWSNTTTWSAYYRAFIWTYQPYLINFYLFIYLFRLYGTSAQGL